jgi:outer membrane protein assembly factor BamE (lipoprotein component of BamABCDE complex)
MRPIRHLPVAPLALALAAATLGGCTQLRSHQGYIVDQTLVASVQPGIDNRASVEGTLGRPTFFNQFGVVEGRGRMVTLEQATDWYYISRNTRQLAFASPRPVDQLTLHVKFDALGNVASVDRTGVELVSRINPESDKTPTLGRERSFFEELFGNIGSVGAGPGAGGGQGGQGGGGQGR